MKSEIEGASAQRQKDSTYEDHSESIDEIVTKYRQIRTGYDCIG